MSANLEVEIARIDERVSDLEEWRNKQNSLLEEIQRELRRLREDWGRRPTWAVTVLISSTLQRLRGHGLVHHHGEVRA
ncbi:MAG: hypothetical protein AB1609_13380 [Bacillota bacterium]